MRHKFLRVLSGIAIIFTAASAPLAASPYHYSLDFTNLNLIPGIEYTLNIRVLDQNGNIASNYFGRLAISAASSGVSLDYASMDVLNGIPADSVTLKVVDGTSVSSIAFSDEGRQIPSLTRPLTAADPESKWQPELPPLVINEIMYNTDLNLDEWLEFYNPNPVSVNVSNYTVVISDKTNPTASCKYQITGSTRTVPVDTRTLTAGKFMVVVRDLSRFQLHYPGIYESVLAQSGDFAGSMIVETGATSGNFDLSGTLETVFIRSNDQVSSPMLSLVCYDGDWGGSAGYSLSRRAPLGSVLSPDNWTSSRSPGGTPGQANDAIVGYPSARGKISLSTNIFDPAFSELAMTIKADREYRHAVVDIVSTAGRTVRNLAKTRSLAAGDLIELTYDGRDENTNILPLGLYFVRFTGFDDNGRPGVSMKAFVLAGGMR